MKKLFEKFFGKKDELVGEWATTNEGGFQMLMATVMQLKADGTGKMVSWGSGMEGEPYGYEHEVKWERLGDNRIKIKTTGSQDFQTVDYVLEEFTGAYNLKYDMLYEPGFGLAKSHGIRGFWNTPGEFFRRK